MREPFGALRRSGAMKVVAAAWASGLILAAGAAAKEIAPGELLVCGATRCRAVTQRAEARTFSAFLWGSSRVARAATPPVGSPVFRLRFRGGPAWAIMNARAIRVHGIDCGRFERGKWYRLPRRLRGLTAGLEPGRLSAVVPRSC